MTDDPSPIVCLPAALSAGGQWRGVRAAWPETRRVFTPDLLGEGRNAPEIGEEAFRSLLPRELAHLKPLIDACDAPVDLVGHSYGGVIAARFANEHPDLVRTLTLIEPVSFELLLHLGPADLVDEVSRIKERCRADVSGGRHPTAAERFVTYWGGAVAWAALDPKARDRAAAGMVKVVAGWEQIWDTPVDLDQYRRFRGPALIVSGSGSPAASRWIARCWAAIILRDARQAVVDGAGHFSPLTHAAVVAGLIEEFRTSLASCR